MNKEKLFVLAFAGLFIIASCQEIETTESFTKEAEEAVVTYEDEGIIAGQYVVILNESSFKFVVDSKADYFERINEVKSVASQLLRTKGSSDFEVLNAYAEVFKGFSAKISQADVAKLQEDPRVKSIQADRLITVGKPVPEPPPEVIPWGITRVGYGDGTGKTAWILDTGIDLDHPDLNVDASRGYDFINLDALADDDNGHGSHCAGIVAAIDNAIGVIGVAAGATLVPVKVLNRRGSGAYSVVIAGVDFVGANASPGDAANMSLTGPVYTLLDDAIYAASQNGIFFALAAGNDSDDANNYSPARVNGPYIWTISAMDINDTFAWFSNYGNPPVDFCEPGVSIYSTYKDGGFATLSGTSMAAPHMCGILLMTNGNPVTDGYVIGDPDGTPDPIGTI
jgi:subtilisin family serine protease